jgi:hypothetical protein
MVTRRAGRNRRNWTNAHKGVLVRGIDFIPFNGCDWAGGVGRRRRYPDCVLPKSEIPPRTLEDMAAAWNCFGAEIMQLWSAPGRRPWAWWLFDSPQPRDNDMPEADQLRRMGQLTNSEMQSLAQEAAQRVRDEQLTSPKGF